MGIRTDSGYAGLKMRQAREACDEAEGLLADGAELRYVVNSIYYAYYYPVRALLAAAGRSAGMHSVSIALFEQLFRPAGIIEDRFFTSISTAFALKPKCAETAPHPIDHAVVEGLVRDARNFIAAAEAAAGREDLARPAHALASQPGGPVPGKAPCPVSCEREVGNR